MLFRSAIPAVHQRPVLLIGPPGIGKTAIMEQAAESLQIGLVAYTITHHTRQSAIGLPVIEKRQFDGKEYTVTEVANALAFYDHAHFYKAFQRKLGITPYRYQRKNKAFRFGDGRP